MKPQYVYIGKTEALSIDIDIFDMIASSVSLFQQTNDRCKQ